MPLIFKHLNIFVECVIDTLRLFEELVIYNGEEFNWIFKTECGELIDIEFIKDKEED